jgi:crotonobetainyl-CoA:carnitine CoA-transferase CaiB-like acyl-CoA transferase
MKCLPRDAWHAGAPLLPEGYPLSKHPLDGLRVIDLTRVLAGPFCTMLLGDRGAEIIKIEEPELGDDTRGWAPFVDGWASYFLGVNRNKKSVALDLKTPDGAEALRRLIVSADVLVENFRPGSLARLGFGYEDARRLNPRLIYCSISGYGQTGPRSGLSGYDPVIQAECGMMDMTGSADGPPMRIGVAMTDFLAGLYATTGILLALVDREQTHEGQHVDVALFDALLSTLPMATGVLQATARVPSRCGNDHPSIAPYEMLRARDADIMIAAANPSLWQRLCAAIDAPHLTADPRFRTNTNRLLNREAMKHALESAFARFSVGDLIDRLQAAAVPCGLVRTVAEALDDPQVDARQLMIEFPDVAGGFKAPGSALKFSRIPPAPSHTPPRLGEHTRVILEGLGLEASQPLKG